MTTPVIGISFGGGGGGGGVTVEVGSPLQQSRTARQPIRIVVIVNDL